MRKKALKLNSRRSLVIAFGEPSIANADPSYDASHQLAHFDCFWTAVDTGSFGYLFFRAGFRLPFTYFIA